MEWWTDLADLQRDYILLSALVVLTVFGYAIFYRRFAPPKSLLSDEDKYKKIEGPLEQPPSGDPAKKSTGEETARAKEETDATAD